MTPVQLQHVAVVRVIVLIGVAIALGIPVGTLAAPSLLNAAFRSSGFGEFQPIVSVVHIVGIAATILAFGYISTIGPARSLLGDKPRELLGR